MSDLVELCWQAFQEYQDAHNGAVPDFLVLGVNHIHKFTTQLQERFATEARRSREYRLKQYMGCHILCSLEEPDAISFAHNPYEAGEAN